MRSMLAKQFFQLEVGSIVTDGKGIYRITHFLSIESVMTVEVNTNEDRQLSIDALIPYDPDSAPAQTPEPSRELSDFSDEEWAVAQMRLRMIKPLLDNPQRTEADADRLAAAAGIHTKTLYRWLSIFTKAGHISALVPGRRGRKPGTTLLPKATEAVMLTVIEDFFLTKDKPTVSSTIKEVKRRCRLAHVVPPHDNTIRNRLADISEPERLRRRGEKDKAHRFHRYRGHFPGADHPLAMVQMDHTPADVICVDEDTRQPIARPWITVAIDVYSRMVLGFYLTYEAPSATSVAMCLAQAMCTKREYLALLDVPGSWPAWGRIQTLHLDNAKEFRGGVLQRACEEYNVNLAWRPVKTPHYGGHIENMMGRVGREMHALPGTTFSNPEERGDYDSEGKAALTLKELERDIADYFVNTYHLTRHSVLGMSPKRKWELGMMGEGDALGVGIPPMPFDSERVLLDFLPIYERTVQQYGIQIEKLHWSDPVLERWVNSTDPDKPKIKRMFTVRVDPRDMSKVHFFDPDALRYFAIPYLDLSHPAISRWELIEAKKELAKQGVDDAEEAQIFECIERRRKRVDEAVSTTKAARKARVRRPGSSTSSTDQRAPVRQGANSAVPPPRPEALLKDDPFAEPVTAFEDVALHR